MSVYVDKLFEWKKGQFWCHMIADTPEELDRMAFRIGIKKEWVQISNSGVRHYDLRPTKRNLAIHFGAIEVSGKEFLRIAKGKTD